MVLGKIRLEKMNKSNQPLKCEADKSWVRHGIQRGCDGLVKHFHHQPSISGASSVDTIVKVCSNTAQPQKHYFFMREERVLLHLFVKKKKKKTQPRNIFIIPHRKSAEPADWQGWTYAWTPDLPFFCNQLIKQGCQCALVLQQNQSEYLILC